VTAFVTNNERLKSKQKVGRVLPILPVLTTLQIRSVLPEFEPLQITL
jgi:hypothetical protein